MQPDPETPDPSPSEPPEAPEADNPTPSPDPAQSADSEAPEAEAGEEAESEGEPPAEQAEQPPAVAASGRVPPNMRGGFQRTISRLEKQNQQLIEMLQRGQAPAPQPPPQPPAPKSEAERTAEQFHELVAKRVNAELAQREAQTQQQKLNADLQQQMAKARVAHPDFDEALADVAHILLPAYVHDAILQSDDKTSIMYSLAKNPAELARISALPPLQAAREIGRLEAKLASGAAPQTPKPGARPPAPPSKVGGSASSSRRLEDLPLADYKRAMRNGRH